MYVERDVSDTTHTILLKKNMSASAVCFKLNWFSPRRESLEVVKEYFVRYAIQDQEILGRKESVEKVLALVPEDILFPVSYRKHDKHFLHK